jgi:cell division protein FtsI/penicillin-binding protein 2
MASSRGVFINRVRLIGGVFSVLMLLFVARTYSLQIIHGQTYREDASGQYLSSAQEYFDRGNIFLTQRDGTPVAAASISREYTLVIQPNRIVDSTAVYNALNAIVPIDKAAFDAHATKTDDPYEEITKGLSEDTAEQIRALSLRGVTMLPVRIRFYPGNSMAAQTIGFVGFDGDKRVGRYGIERYYENVLARSNNEVYNNAFTELFANVRDLVFVPAEEQEGDVITSIEPNVQAFLEAQLEDTRTEWGSKKTAGIVMDPVTGTIIAMAVSPSFDLNDFGNANGNAYPNILVENVFEVGSIMKPLTVAAALDAGAITEKTTYNDTGSRTFDKHTIYNYDKRARGVVPVQEILSQSLNVGIAFVVEKMGKENLRRYFERYGLREETGIDLPAEAAPLTNNLDSPRMIEYVTAGYGQGIAVTPLSVARALSVLPDGYIEDPHVATAIQLKSGITHSVNRDQFRHQVLKPETVETITRMLVNVTDNALAGGKYKHEHYSIAAKTGTAQIAAPTGGYYDDRYLHTFFGYFPAYQPRFLVFLMNLEPQHVQYASQTLTEPFMHVADYLINYYQIPPDR